MIQIIDQIPDTRVRDRLIEIKDMDTLAEIGRKGNDGYVVHTVPLAIAAANQVNQIGLERMYQQIIDIGGDTDTNCSIAGQIAGALLGRKGMPNHLIEKLSALTEYNWIQQTVEAWIEKNKWIR